MILQVGVKIFLRNPEGKFLLVRRSREKYPDVKPSWDIPGGRINQGLPLRENLEREVLEETKLKILSVPKLLAAQDIIRGEEKHVVRLSYFGLTEGEPELDLSENERFCWLSLEDLKNERELDEFARGVVDGGFLDGVV